MRIVVIMRNTLSLVPARFAKKLAGPHSISPSPSLSSLLSMQIEMSWHVAMSFPQNNCQCVHCIMNIASTQVASPGVAFQVIKTSQQTVSQSSSRVQCLDNGLDWGWDREWDWDGDGDCSWGRGCDWACRRGMGLGLCLCRLHACSLSHSVCGCVYIAPRCILPAF